MGRRRAHDSPSHSSMIWTILSDEIDVTEAAKVTHTFCGESALGPVPHRRMAQKRKRRMIDGILHDASHADAPHRQASTSDVAAAVRKREEQKLFAPSIFTLHRNSYLNTQQHERFYAMSKAMGVGLPGARRIPLSAPHSLSVLRSLPAQLFGCRHSHRPALNDGFPLSRSLGFAIVPASRTHSSG